MKKVLALLLCILTLSSCFVFSTSATVAADYDWRKVIYDAGYGTIVSNTVAVAPTIDGVVNEGEYTKYDKFTIDIFEGIDWGTANITALTMSYAHDLKYVYIAIQQDTNYVQDLSQMLNLQLGARNKEQGLAKDVWDNRFDMTNSFNNDGTPVIYYDASGAPITKWNDVEYEKHKTSLFYYGPEFEYGKDVEVKTTLSNGNKTRTQEFKLSKDYLKKINYLLNPTDDPDRDFLSVQWCVNSQKGLYNTLTTQNMRAKANIAGDDSAAWFAWPVYFVDYDFREQVANDGSAIFAGAKLARENLPIIDGVIGDNEYTSSVVYTSGSAPAWVDTSVLNLKAADINKITLNTAHDGKNLYMALEVVKNATPKRTDLADKIWMQWCAYDKPNNLLATNFANRSQATLEYNTDGTAKNIPANSAIVASVFKSDYAEGGVTGVYEYKFDLDILSEKYTKANPKCKDGLPEMSEADYTYRDTFFVRMFWNGAATAASGNSLASCGSVKFLQISPKLSPTTLNAITYCDNSETAYGSAISWGYTPIFLFANNAPATNETASVRISYDHAGIRFQTRIAEWDVQELVNKYGYEDVKVGTLIAPADALGGNKLTHEFGKADQDYLDVPADVANPYTKSNCVYTYAGSIVNINPKNLGRDFVAVGYIAYTDTAGETHYIYSDSACTRNVSEIATAALSDTTANYTDAHKAILSALIVK